MDKPLSMETTAELAEALEYHRVLADEEERATEERTMRRRQPVLAVALILTVACLGSGAYWRWSNGIVNPPSEIELTAQLHALFREKRFSSAPLIQLPADYRSPLSTNLEGHLLTPVVFMHGMGDSGSSAEMQSLCKAAREAYPGLYVVCATVADDLASVTTPLSEQVEEFSTYVRRDPQLASGFHAVGLSQGGLVLRGYIETKNDPPVRRFISMCTAHSGMSACPSTQMYRTVCPLWRLAPYTANLAFADYWKDPDDKATYLERSRWLADVNNEHENKNEAYKRNMAALERYVLIEATNDTTVVPHASESHGFFAWGGGKSQTVVPLRQSEGYKGDFIGLKTLDDQGKLLILNYHGDHLSFTSKFFADVVLPHLS